VGQQAIEKRTWHEQSLSYPALGAMVGGFVGLLGIFIGWFAHDVLVTDGHTAVVVASGTADLTGQLATVGAVLAFGGGGAMLLLADSTFSRWATLAAAAGAAALVVFSVLGLFRADAVFADAAAVPGTAGVARSSFGAYLSALGGIAAVAAVMVTFARGADVIDEANIP
jgi:hypothetical protein